MGPHGPKRPVSLSFIILYCVAIYFKTQYTYNCVIPGLIHNKHLHNKHLHNKHLHNRLIHNGQIHNSFLCYNKSLMMYYLHVHIYQMCVYIMHC